MISYAECSGCGSSFNLIISAEDIPLIEHIEKGGEYQCPRLCGSYIKPSSGKSNSAKNALTLTGVQLYQASFGMGLPDEVPKDTVVVDSLLKSSRVVGTVTELKSGRVYLHEITLENGTTIHLASGARGSEVLKITKDVKCQQER